MAQHTIIKARYLWNYIVECTFDDCTTMAYDIERVIKGSHNPAVSQYVNVRRFQSGWLVSDKKALTWRDLCEHESTDNMVFDANWLYAIIPDNGFFSPERTIITVNCNL